MTNSRRKKSERCAIELLNRQKKLSFYDMAHLDVRKIDTGEDIMFDTFTGYCASVGLREDGFMTGGQLPDGMTVSLGDRYLVLYDERVASPARRNWTLAHELGHILLHHDGISGAREEREANAFAAELLMPSAALAYLAHITASPLDTELVCASFNVSHEAAARRIAELSSPDRARRRVGACEIQLLIKLFGRINIRGIGGQR